MTLLTFPLQLNQHNLGAVWPEIFGQCGHYASRNSKRVPVQLKLNLDQLRYSDVYRVFTNEWCSFKS